ncbi:MAG: FliH/SctL family protein [Candidatus Contubernalis sp.]|nr:FliH/SctL family protein [Candidatus Contubernalis sp.]
MNNIIKAPRESGVCQIPLEKEKLMEPSDQGKDEGEHGIHPPENESFQFIEEARQEAAAIIKKAESEAKSLQEAAYKKGLETGQAEGMADAQQKEEKILKEAREFLAETVELREMVLKAAESQVVELALQVAEALIHKKLETEKNFVVDIVAEALALVVGEESIMVKVNPDDLKTCCKYKDFFQDIISEGAKFKLLQDENVPQGSCRVFTQDSLVESFLDERFKALKEALLKEADYAYLVPRDES